MTPADDKLPPLPNFIDWESSYMYDINGDGVTPEILFRDYGRACYLAAKQPESQNVAELVGLLREAALAIHLMDELLAPESPSGELRYAALVIRIDAAIAKWKGEV